MRARAAEGVPAEGGKRGGEGCNKNSGEALVVGLLVDALRKCGVVNGDIGVISPYRAQVISASIYDRHSGSTKITTHLDHISYCKTESGTN